MGQGENAGEQKWGAAVGPGLWRRQEAVTVRPAAAAAAAVAVVVVVVVVAVVAAAAAAAVVGMTAF